LGYPRSGLERSDFVLWHETDLQPRSPHVRYQGMNGSRSDAARGLKMDPKQTSDPSGRPATVGQEMFWFPRSVPKGFGVLAELGHRHFKTGQ
jgi:hypothetical protein